MAVRPRAQQQGGGDFQIFRNSCVCGVILVWDVAVANMWRICENAALGDLIGLGFE